ncbi:MAG TPA: cyclic nucleotide-binding domain-containing protein [Spirochaetota bacterium]|nr:cyclic nucleotide-binding domain-containing protein [Spirochaetota bacterium]HPI90024.1 cyclic nucleotide-binding domain-containing protein [Spirochaetota bacterium]HPR48094.1 cyclic nucleotide-binding domain-containing protein [Spirochaetota bacterium]
MPDKSGELLKKGQVLFAQGEIPREIYVLDDGSLEIIASPDEYNGLAPDIIISKGRRIGILSGKTMIAGFSRMFTDVYTKSVRAMEDSHVTRYPLPQGGYKGILARDLSMAVSLLKQLYNVINGSLSTANKVRKVYQTLAVMYDNFSLIYKEFLEATAPDDLHKSALELYSRFTGSGGIIPPVVDAKFLITDYGRYFEKKYEVPGSDPENIIDKLGCGLVIKLLKLDPSILQAMVKADPGIALSAYEILTENFMKTFNYIEQAYERIDEKMSLLFSSEESWSQYFVDWGGFDELVAGSKISGDFIKNLLSVLVKLNGIYDELSGAKLTDYYPGIKKIHSYYMKNREGAVETKAESAMAEESTATVAEKSPAFIPGKGKGRSLNEIFEFSLIDKEFKGRFLKVLNDFKTMKNPFNTEMEGRKIRRHLAKMYWDLFKQVYIRSKTESAVPRAVKLMLLFGFCDDDLLEESQVAELNDLARLRERETELPVVIENEFLNLVYTGTEEPSITEMGLDYRSYLRELEKSRKKKDADPHVGDENIRRVMYEIDQRLTSTAAVCSGSTATAFPILNSFAIKGSLKGIYTSKKSVEDIVKEIKEMDFSVFYRETVLKMGEAREIIQEEIEPYFIILPIFGTKTLLWQEVIGTNKRSRGRIVIPIFFMGDLKKSIAHTLACFRWELNRSMKGAMWADPIDGGITGEYFDYVNTFKKNSKLSVEAKEKINERFKALRTNRDRFADDYLMWVLFEKDGIMKLNNVVREMFFKHIPFPEEVRNKLESMPAFAHAANRYKNLQVRNIAAYERKFKKYQGGDGGYPEEIQKFFNFIKK